MKRSAFYFALLLLFVSPASAHDAEHHKGPKIEGKLISVQGDNAQVHTEQGTVAVLLSAETKYEAGAEGKPASKADLKDGSALMVHGHKLESGEFGATAVLINPAAHKKGTDEPSHHSK